MLFLLNKDIRTAKWNGLPLHETSSAIVKETLNGDFTLSIRYPIIDSGIYKQIKEDMLIKAPVPVLGFQLFRIKKPIENDDSLDITAYHISDDIMQRSIEPISVANLTCGMALSQMVQNTKTNLGDFSFTSDVTDRRTFNTNEVKTLYAVLMDGAHSIIGTWEGELIRDNLALTIKKNRGENRGVVITTHKNLKSYKRIKSTQSIITRIHAKSTFKPDGKDKDQTIKITVDSPLITFYPYINEKEYENNTLKSIEELRKWAEAKFKNEGIDKLSDAITIEAYELDGQVVHLGDTVYIKSMKHEIDTPKKAVAYEFDALTQEYISITFDDKPMVGASTSNSAISTVANEILDSGFTLQEVAIEKALRNANTAFDAEFTKQKESILDDIEKVKASAEVYADGIRQEIEGKIADVDSKVQSNESLNENRYNDVLAKANSSRDLANHALEVSKEVKETTNTVLTDTLNYKKEAIAEANRLVELSKNSLLNQITTVESSIDKLKGVITNKVSKTDFDAIKNTVEQQRTEISQAKDKINLKAEKTYVENIKQTTSEALQRISENALAISKTKADLQVAADAINTKVSQTDFNQTTNRLASTETTIKIQAGEIAKRLTSSQVESIINLKGFQTKSDVDKNILDRGYVTNSNVQNLVRETSNSFSRTISEAKALIPTSVSHRNLAAGSSDSWTSYKEINSKLNWIQTIGKVPYGDSTGIYAGTKINLFVYISVDNVVLDSTVTPRIILQGPGYKKSDNSAVWSVHSNPFHTSWSSVLKTGTNYHLIKISRIVTDEMFNNFKNFELQFRIDGASSGKFRWRALMITTGDIFPNYWTKPIEDLTTVTAFNEVKDTLGSHTRTISEQGKTISQVVQTSEGLITRVSDLIDNQNLVYDPTNFSKYKEREPNSNLVMTGTNEYKLLRIAQSGRTTNGWRGFQMPLHSQKFVAGEKLSYRVNLWIDVLPDGKVGFEIKSGNSIGGFTISPTRTGAAQIFTGTFTINKTVTKTDDFGLHIWVEKNGTVAVGQISIVRGSQPPKNFVDSTSFQQIATESLVQQHQGSYSIQNLTNAGSLISGINLGANGINRIIGKATHITGDTLIDRAVIKSGMIDKLKTSNFESGSVTTMVLASNSVTADKIVVDQAFFNKLVANEAYLRQLFAKNAFINSVQSVRIDASQIKSGLLSGDRIQGGTITGTTISGGLLTGETKIKLGAYGSFDAINGGLQINVPRQFNSKDGLGVQFIGSYGRGDNVPYGLFIYKDSDFTTGNTASDSDDFLLTVEGYIKAKGIGWLKYGKSSINGSTTGTISYWNSNNVSLDFGGSGNDIYYSYNGNAYSLWQIVNQHFSDKNLKENIGLSNYKALDFIKRFQFKEYDWKKIGNRIQKAHTKIGLIAQDVQQIDSSLVYENGGFLNLDNTRLTNIALKGIQELILDIRKLNKRLEMLEDEHRFNPSISNGVVD